MVNYQKQNEPPLLPVAPPGRINNESQIPGNVCNEYSETLNSPITEDEVSKAVKRLHTC